MNWNAPARPGVVTSIVGQSGVIPDNYLEQYNLGDAVSSQQPQLIARLLKIKGDTINDPGSGGLRPLHRACARGHLQIVQMLIAHGADLETLSDTDEPPIHYACKRGNPSVIDAMMKAGADVTKVDKLGRSMLHHAAQSGSVFSLLFLEAALPQLRMDACDNSGRSLMHYACLHGHMDVVRFLLKRSRCPVDLADDKGNTCMHLLAGSTFDDIAWLLTVKAGGFKLMTVPNKEGETPPDIANKLPTSDGSYASTRSFFRLCRVMPSAKQFHMQAVFVSIFLFCFPFFAFLAAILAAKFLLPKWEILIFSVTSLGILTFVRTQSHRIGDFSRQPNPIFAGAYAAGFLHALICFYFEVLPFVRYTWIPKVAMVLCPIHIIIYVSLLLGDAGSIKPGDGSPEQRDGTFADVVRQEAVQQDTVKIYSSLYCSSCEFAYTSQWIKHCKLCQCCFVEMDHHCLFLMNCVARRNHRRFVWLIIFSVVGIAVFLWSIYVKFHQVCAMETSLFPIAICVVHRSPWAACNAVFNGGSLIWGLYMLYSCFLMLSGGVTFYFRGKMQRISWRERISNLTYFMVHGRVRRRDLPRCCDHSHGV